MIARPFTDEFDSFYQNYIDLVTEPDVLAVLERQAAELRGLATALPPDRETFRYEPGKWSVRQVLGHMTDSERVFGYRAFRVSRGDETPLPGFDQNVYVDRSAYSDVPAHQLAEEFGLVRAANLAFLRRLEPSHWTLRGTANNSPVSLRALAYIMAGHVKHHRKVLKDHYGIS